MVDEQFVGVLPCIADAFGFAIGDGDGVDGVGILMIEDKEIIFATAGGDVEMTSLIRIGLQKRLIVEKHDSNLMGARLELRGKKALHQKALNVTVYQNYYKTQMIIHYSPNSTFCYML